jgi:hypothetical protein
MLCDLQRTDGEKNVKLPADLARAQRRFLSEWGSAEQQPTHDIAFSSKNRKLAKTLQ